MSDETQKRLRARDAFESALIAAAFSQRRIEPSVYKTDFGDLKWIRVEDYGRTLSAMRGEGPVDFGPVAPPQGSP